MSESNHYPKALIKPSLHSMSEQIISSKVLQTCKSHDRNGQSMPFKALSKCLISCHSSAASSSGVTIESDGRHFDINSLSHEKDFEWFRKKQMSGYSEGDYCNKVFDSTSSASSTASSCLWDLNQTKTNFDHNFTATKRLFNSCPSSPVIKRLPSETIQSRSASKRKQQIFHFNHGSDVTLSPDLSTASRSDDKSSGSNCYVFVSQYLSLNTKLTIEIVESDPLNCGQSFIFGVTDVDPSSLDSALLPDKPTLLIANKDQLWIMVDNFCDHCRPNDSISLVVDSSGFIYFSVNRQKESLLIPTPVVCHNRYLWPFFNIIGPIKAIKLTDSDIKCNINYLKTNRLYNCLNCWSNWANTAFYRCGHKYYCYECAQLLAALAKKCPLCGTKIIDLLIVFP